jgi:hypothetical protein
MVRRYLGRERIGEQWWLVERNPRDLSEFTPVEPLKFIYSPTGESHGSGSDRFRWVSRLTSEERRAARDGHVVVITKYVSSRAPQPVQVVTYTSGRYDHRVPNDDILDECLAVAGYPTGS